MADSREEDSDRALPSKRKPDLNPDDPPPSKAPKSLDSVNGDAEKPVGSGAQDELHGFDFGEDDEEEDEDYAEEEDGEGEVDSKGKGVLKGDDKGKGKLVFDDSDDDSDSSGSSDDGDLKSGSDSELAEDPLAEVDLDNILPSRTRQRRPMPGLVIDGDRRRNGGNDGSST